MESPAEEDVVFTDDLVIVSDAVEKKEVDEKKEAEMEAMVEEEDEEPKDEKPEKVAASAVARKTKRLVRGGKGEYAVVKPFRRAVVVIYKRILSMVRQVFKMVASLHGLGNSDLPSDHVVRDMIDKTKVWLVDQMGQHFPPKRSNYLLKRWRTLEPLLRRLVGGGQDPRPLASSSDNILVPPSVPASSLPSPLPEDSSPADVSPPISSSSSV